MHPFLSEAAHLLAYQGFSRDFLSRFPAGVTLHDLEYLAATTSARLNPFRIQFSGKPRINHVIDAMAEDFRRQVRPRDYRKPDGLGISADAHFGEAIEVTIVSNMPSAVKQVREKLDTLNVTVNAIGRLKEPYMPMPEWKPGPWRPTGRELFQPITPGVVLSFEPTYRVPAPQGVLLYELIERQPEPAAAPVPAQAAEAIRQERSTIRQQTAGSWARNFGVRHPYLLVGLRTLAFMAGLTAAIAAVILLLDPLPGDEVLAAGAATALLAFATTGSVPARFN